MTQKTTSPLARPIETNIVPADGDEQGATGDPLAERQKEVRREPHEKSSKGPNGIVVQ